MTALTEVLVAAVLLPAQLDQVELERLVKVLMAVTILLPQISVGAAVAAHPQQGLTELQPRAEMVVMEQHRQFRARP